MKNAEDKFQTNADHNNNKLSAHSKQLMETIGGLINK